MRWRIKINPNKTQAIYFSHKFKLPPKIHINNQPIPWSNNITYLGVIIDRRLTWNLHIKKISRSYNFSLHKLNNLLNSNHLNIRNKILLFKSYILPTITYASPVWAFAADTHINKLQTLINKTLRRIRRAPWYVRNSTIRKDLQIPTLRDIIQKLSINFYNTLNNLDNEIILELPDYDYRDPSNRKKPRFTQFLSEPIST